MKTRKAVLAAVAATISGIVAFSLAGCEWFSFSGKKNRNHVSSSLGYENDMGAWLASSVSSPRSSALELYEEAKASGAIDESVTFMDFLKALNDDSASLSTSLRASIAIVTNTSAGSGVIYSLHNDGDDLNAYVITNYHVVYSSGGIAKNIYAFLYGDPYAVTDTTLKANYVGGSADEDLAVLTMTIPQDRANYVQSISEHVGKRDSDDVNAGEKVYAIGNPLGGGISVVSGIVAVEAEYTKMKSITGGSDPLSLLTMRIDAPVNHGNSGGGLFDRQGTFLGIVNGGSEQSIGDESVAIGGFGYALPANRVVSVVQSVLDNTQTNETKAAYKGLLGTLEVVSSRGEFNEVMNSVDIVETVVLKEVDSRSPFGSELAGKVIKKIIVTDEDGETIVSKSILRKHEVETILYNIRKGFTLTLVFDGEEDVATAQYTEDSHFIKVS